MSNLTVQFVNETLGKSPVDAAAMPDVEDQNGHRGIGYPANRPVVPNAVPPQSGEIAGQCLPSGTRIIKVGDTIFKVVKNAALPRAIYSSELFSRGWG